MRSALVACVVASTSWTACVGSEPTAEPEPRSISSLIALPASLEWEASYVRGFDGTVALVETVSLIESVPGRLIRTGIEDVNTRAPEGRFVVRVVDGLGGTWSEGREVPCRR